MKKILIMILVVSMMITFTSISTFAAKGGNAGANDNGKSKSATQDITSDKKPVVDNQIVKKNMENSDSTITNTSSKKNVIEKITVEQRKQAIKEIVAQKRIKNDYTTPVIVNGKDVNFDIPPVIKYGRTLIPVRAITNALGGVVQWNSETKTVTITKGDITISIVLGSNIVMVNGKETTLDVPAQLVSNRTMVPIRFIAQALKQQVEWDEDTGAVVIDDEEETSTITPETSPSSTPEPTEEPTATVTPVPTEPDVTATPSPTVPDVSQTPVVTETPVVVETTPSPTPEPVQ